MHAALVDFSLSAENSVRRVAVRLILGRGAWCTCLLAAAIFGEHVRPWTFIRYTHLAFASVMDFLLQHGLSLDTKPIDTLLHVKDASTLSLLLSLTMSCLRVAEQAFIEIASSFVSRCT